VAWQIVQPVLDAPPPVVPYPYGAACPIDGGPGLPLPLELQSPAERC